MPSFTERVKAKDYGIDAEWDVEHVGDGHDHRLLGSGWNVYQYKMRDLSNRDRLMEREQVREKLDALSRQKVAAKEGLYALAERRRKVREIDLSRAKILTHYRGAAPEALEKADGKKRRAVYNTLGVTIWPARAKGDPTKIMFSALGGEEVCHSDVTPTK
jgi:hypothetical protein